MIIMQYGTGLQPREWIVQEEYAPQYVRIYHIDSGTVTYHGPVGDVPLKKGCLYVFPAQTAYSITQEPDDPISCLWMHVDVFPWLVRQLIEIDPEKHDELRQTLKLLRAQVDYPELNASCVEAFAKAMLQLMARDGFLHERVDSRLVDAELLSADASVEAVSRKIGYTQEHFIRTFSREVGVTPYQYILSQRMNEAISLMSQGVMLDEIAVRTGYASGKSFAGAFKRRFGIAPSVYREYFLKKA